MILKLSRKTPILIKMYAFIYFIKNLMILILDISSHVFLIFKEKIDFKVMFQNC